MPDNGCILVGHCQQTVMCPLPGAVLSTTLIGSEYIWSNAFFQRSKHCGFRAPALPQFDELLQDADSTLLSPIAVTSSINFYRHFYRLHSITVCLIELISSTYRAAQDVDGKLFCTRMYTDQLTN